jgi:hypothetical protein
MDNPMVSVIIAVRNGERFLRLAIESVLAQTYRPFEIVVIDGHSDDQTAAIAGSFPEARVVPQAGRGVADAYNLGIESAKADFIAFLSHDDLWTPDKLRSGSFSKTKSSYPRGSGRNCWKAIMLGVSWKRWSPASRFLTSSANSTQI